MSLEKLKKKVMLKSINNEKRLRKELLKVISENKVKEGKGEFRVNGRVIKYEIKGGKIVRFKLL